MFKLILQIFTGLTLTYEYQAGGVFLMSRVVS